MTNPVLNLKKMVDNLAKLDKTMVLVLYFKHVYGYDTIRNEDMIGEYHFKTATYSCEISVNNS